MENNSPNNKNNRSKAIRRLVIWYRRNSPVTSLVDTATSSATAVSNVAGSVVSNAGSVVTNAGSIALSTLEPFVFDPLRRLQGGDISDEKNGESPKASVKLAMRKIPHADHANSRF